MRGRILAIALLLTGCQSYSLEQLRQATPSGSSFQQALAKEYLLLASQEEANYDWSDSWYFADKGLTAAYGHDVGPELVEHWDVPGGMRAELDTQRDALISVLKPEVVEANPALAARAYRYFDCWLERLDDGWEQEKINECQQGFEHTLADLRVANQPVAKTASVDVSSYIVFFSWNHATLSEAGQRVVSDVAQALSDQDGYEVVLYGHTDTTGLERFNLKLSKLRAEAVARALVGRGVDEAAIKIFAFGESDPKVPTADEVDEPKNRRVEIFIQ